MIPTPLLALSGLALGASEAVQIERLRLVGVAIAATASTVAAVLQYRNGRELRAARRRRRDREAGK